jgi:hypothetical protein
MFYYGTDDLIEWRYYFLCGLKYASLNFGYGQGLSLGSGIEEEPHKLCCTSKLDLNEGPI